MTQWEDVPVPTQGHPATGEAWPDAHSATPGHLSAGYPETPEHSGEDTPFGGINHVDGLVYSPEDVSPELQWQSQQVQVPRPPVRQRPQPPAPAQAAPWKPGPDPVPAQARSRMPVKVLAVTLIPLAVLAGFGWLVYRVMQAYGY